MCVYVCMYIYVYNTHTHTHIHTHTQCYGCNMCTGDLTDMYALTVYAQAQASAYISVLTVYAQAQASAYISVKSRVHMLQLLCNTLITIVTR